MARLLTLAECAERTGTTVRWWRRAIFERRVAVVRLGRLVRIAEPDLEAFIASNTEPARSAVADLRARRGLRGAT